MKTLDFLGTWLVAALLILSTPLPCFAKLKIGTTEAPLPIPVQNYAVIDISGTTTQEDGGPHDVTLMALDDQNNAAFAFTSGLAGLPGFTPIWLFSPPGFIHAYHWLNGMLGSDQPTNLANPPSASSGNYFGPDPYNYNYSCAFPTSIDAMANVYGWVFYGYAEDSTSIINNTQGQISNFFESNGSASIIPLPEPFMGWTDPGYPGPNFGLEGPGPGYVSSKGFLSGCINSGSPSLWLPSSNGPVWGFGLGYIISPSQQFTVFDPTNSYDPTQIGSNLDVQPFDFVPYAVNNNGAAVGIDYGQSGQSSFWNGQSNPAVPLPGIGQIGDTPAGLNDQNQVIMQKPYPGQGYLWENSVTSTLSNNGPVGLLRASIFNVGPFSISNQFGPAPGPVPPSLPASDVTIHILATAANLEDSLGSVWNAPYETFVWTRDTSGNWTFAKPQLPIGTKITRWISINSSGVIAAIGTLTTTNSDGSTSTSALKAFLLVPVQFEVQTWTPVVTNPNIYYLKDRIIFGKIVNGESFSLDAMVNIHVPPSLGALAQSIASEWDLWLVQDLVAQGNDSETWPLIIHKHTAVPVPGPYTNWEAEDDGADPGDIPRRLPFTENNESVDISLGDSPGNSFLSQWSPPLSGLNPIKSAHRNDTFVTWLLARNRNTKQKCWLKWIRWNVSFDVTFDFTKNPPDNKNVWKVEAISSGDGQGSAVFTDKAFEVDDTTQIVP